MESDRTEANMADLASLRIRRDQESPSGSGGKSRARGILIAAAVLVIGCVLYLLFARGGPIEVTTATADRLSPAGARSLLTATGYVVAQRKADVASKGTGRLEVLNVEEGDRVHAGDVIGEIEAADVEAAFAAARAVVEQAEAETLRTRAVLKEARLAFDRVQGLRENSLASDADFDAAEARRESADAAARAAAAALASAVANARWAQVQVENTYIRAPFDGTVLTKYADVGEVVAPFAASASSRGAVVTLADMTSLQVEADVGEASIRRITVGQPCLITLDAMPAEPYRGRVVKIVPTADRAKATVLVKVAFESPDDRVLPEMSARVSFLPESTDPSSIETGTVLAVPRAAVADRDGRTVVFVVDGERVRETPVDVGTAYGGAIEIRSGLSEGEAVVVDPPEKLRGGGRIRLKP
jgi:RND family efflux transporter MFP subunit